MGVQRGEPPLSRLHPLPGLDVAGWRRCQRDARVRHRGEILRRGRLSRTGLEVGLLLAGQGHCHCLGRLRGGGQDPVRLSARGQALAARHETGGGDADLRGRKTGSRGRRRGRDRRRQAAPVPRPHASTSSPRTASCGCLQAKTGASLCRTTSPTRLSSRASSSSACAARGRRRTARAACPTALYSLDFERWIETGVLGPVETVLEPAHRVSIAGIARTRSDCSSI